tara:strand:+ start:435 stop:1118 length:684 start_codon:yes stop_codon:yes gene_type:complete
MLGEKKIYKKIKYEFNDERILLDAITHTTKSKRKNSNFQRLEFLGDRILGLIIADILYNRFPNDSEGDLTRRMHHLVNEDTLAKIAKNISLNEYIRLNYNEEKSGGREKSAILSDSLEALIAAIFIDSDYQSVYKFISIHWADFFKYDEAPPIDPKTKLQEWCHSKGIGLPRYIEVAKKGPDHSPEFTVNVILNGDYEVEAIGNTKKQAERNAAIKALGSEYVKTQI